MNKKISLFKAIKKLSAVLLLFLALGCMSTGGAAATVPPDIGISWCEDPAQEEHGEDLQAYIDTVAAAGGNPVLLPLIENENQAKEILGAIDGLVLTGGEDIDPSLYGEAPHANLEYTNPQRDASDSLLLAAALKSDFPVVAVCRGVQFLNVFQGGTLYQDLPSQYGTDQLHRSADEVDFEYHDIAVEEGSLLAGIMGQPVLNANSWHHQGIKDVGAGLDVIAIAEDGMIEALQLDDAAFVLGVQFHPEWHYVEGDTEYLAIFEELVKFASE